MPRADTPGDGPRVTAPPDRHGDGDYESASSLPSFTLLPWFFIVPGLLLIGLSGFSLLAARRASHEALPEPTPSH